jgi:DNA (cytosine-5)-methyltransferase 1
VNYYNENDPKIAEWLKRLVANGRVPPGVIDTRSIAEVRPSDLRGFTQCHFFAGVCGWPLALKRAGWPEDRPIWTGSCPCQPFSSAGLAEGFSDDRHLWPVWRELIKECQPSVVFGEQVASKAADEWIDLVQSDLEALGYAVGAVPFPSAGVGAPHIRDRMYWVADTASIGLQRRGSGQEGNGGNQTREQPERLCDAVGLGDTNIKGSQGHAGDGGQERWGGAAGSASQASLFDGLADMYCDGCGKARQRKPTTELHGNPGSDVPPKGQPEPGPVNGPWGDADWLFCRDGKWRPVRSGTFPLANGVPSRVVRLRGYGNAINVEAARVFIECYMGK